MKPPLPRRLQAMWRLARRNPPLRMPWTLRRLGVLNMNRRNAHYIMPHNRRQYYPRVDDKLQTKRLAMEAGIAVPALLGVVEIEHQIHQLDRILNGCSDFVIKPAHGSGGNGIMVLSGRRAGYYVRASGTVISADEVQYFISNILSGMYSLGGMPDRAMLEYRVRPHSIFDTVSFQGVPDIRTVVFRGMPVASMVRLPTRQSGGKANLHQGAVGAGVDLLTGRTLSGVWFNHSLGRHPDSGNPVRNIEIPDWDRLLNLAARCYDLTGLGYLGVDIVLDRDHGPLVLECNARPGLNIQLANRSGLLGRLRKIEALAQVPDRAEDRVALAKELFTAAS